MQAGILSFVGDVALCDAALTAVTACGGAFVLPVPPRTQLLCVIIVFKTIGKTHAFVCRHHSSSRPEAACRETCRHCSVGQYERTDRNELTQRIAERNTFVSWASSAKKGIVQRADSNPVVTSHTGGSSAAGRPVGHSSPAVHMTLLTYFITSSAGNLLTHNLSSWRARELPICMWRKFVAFTRGQSVQFAIFRKLWLCLRHATSMLQVLLCKHAELRMLHGGALLL